MNYPKYAEIKGIKYPLNCSYQNALECFEIIEDETICDEERALAVIYKIFGFLPDKDLELFLEKAILFLQCGETKEEQSSKKKNMDFIQDKKYIFSSFMSDYKIDLSKEDLHFWKFIDMIIGLTPDSSLSRLRDLRDIDLSKIKDKKERDKIADAQKRVALKEKKTLEEIKMDELFDKLMKGE